MADDTEYTLREHPAHFLIYGESGTGGSTGIATFPSPILVFFFDPVGKDVPYLKRGVIKAGLEDEFGTPITQVMGRKSGRLLIQLEYYRDEFTASETGKLIDGRPDAYERFLRRMARFRRDDYANWATVVLDSVTYAELAARNQEEFVLNAGAKDPRQWYGGSKHKLEQMLMIRFGSLPMNVALRAHVDIAKDEITGAIYRSAKAVGTLGRDMPAGYSEVYRSMVVVNAGARTYTWQTQADAQWPAQTHIDAPNPCRQEYKALWEGRP